MSEILLKALTLSAVLYPLSILVDMLLGRLTMTPAGWAVAIAAEVVILLLAYALHRRTRTEEVSQ